MAQREWIVGMLLLVACSGDAKPQQSRQTPTSSAASTASAGEAGPQRPLSRAAALQALDWLRSSVRVPAGDPQSPWALAHGLLAFGRDFSAADGRSAIAVIASFALLDPSTDRYHFEREESGKPVEPHSYLLVKKLLEIGVEPSFVLKTRDGSEIDVRRLLRDMRAGVRLPEDDRGWHDAAWWMTAIALDPASTVEERAQLLEAALKRLEADDSVIAGVDEHAFAPDAPMGQAKREKSHIFGHACGGLHMVQAVLHLSRVGASPEQHTRIARQVELLIQRHGAERALYQQMLHARPDGALLVTGQQLKFFGHVLEALALAVDVGAVPGGSPLSAAVLDARRATAADLVRSIEQLRGYGSYRELSTIAKIQPQTALDLVGDGCHAIHGLQQTLSVL